MFTIKDYIIESWRRGVLVDAVEGLVRNCHNSGQKEYLIELAIALSDDDAVADLDEEFKMLLLEVLSEEIEKCY